MRSERLAALVLALVAGAGCGSSSFDDDLDKGFLVGRSPEFYSAAYLWQGGESNTVVTIDQKGHTVQSFTLEPFEHRASIPLPLDGTNQSVVASSDGAYFVTIADSNYALVRADGESTANPVELLGKIKSVAYDPVNHLVVLSDEFQTMALLALDASGNFIKGWKAGNLITANLYVRSGTMLKDGRLALAVGPQDDSANDQVVLADVKASIAANAWVYPPAFVVPNAKGIAWMAQVPDAPDILLAIEDTRLLTINIATQAVVAEKPLTATSLKGYFRDYYPHVVTQTSAQSVEETHEITYPAADGSLVSKNLKASNKRIAQTWLDPRTLSFTVAFDPDSVFGSYTYEEDPYRRYEIYRFQLSDNAAIDKTEVEDVSLVVTPRFVFLLYETVLGKAERRTYGKNPDPQVLEGYNFPIIRDRYRN